MRPSEIPADAVDITGLRQAMAPHYCGGRVPSRTTVFRWVAHRGCPVGGRFPDGRPWFRVADVIAWWYYGPQVPPAEGQDGLAAPADPQP